MSDIREKLSKEQLDAFMAKLYPASKSNYHSLLNPEITDISPDDLSCTAKYGTAPWMINVNGFIHGGVTASMADNTMGIVLMLFLESFAGSSTISISMNYLRPVMCGSSVSVKAHIDKLGKNIAFISVVGWCDDNAEKPVFTCSGQYFISH